MTKHGRAEPRSFPCGGGEGGGSEHHVALAKSFLSLSLSISLSTYQPTYLSHKSDLYLYMYDRRNLIFFFLAEASGIASAQLLYQI
jgi:hypothetical protein